MKSTLFFLVLLCTLTVEAQYSRQLYHLFDESPGWPKSGWLFAGGITYDWARPRTKTDAVLHQQLNGDITGGSKPGIYAEIGRFHIVPAGIIFNNVDYSIAFRQHRDFQRLTGVYSFYDRDSLQTVAVTDQAKRTENTVSVNFNLNSVIQFSDYQWIQPSLGIHGNYTVSESRASGLDTAVTRYVYPGQKLQVLLHAKFAYGAKLTNELFIVPGLEVGLWQLNDLHNITLKKNLFHSKYIPLVFSVKFLLHRPLNLKPCDIEVEEVDLTKVKRSKKKVKMF